MSSILVLIVLSPLFITYSDLSFILNIFFSFILLTCVFSLSGRTAQFTTGAALSLPYLLTMWVAQQYQHPNLQLLSYFLGICYFFYVFIILLVNLMQQPEVNLETIFGAVSAYLLMGLAWSLIFAFIETTHPGSFSVPDTIPEEQRYTFIYFSFITLTTLGYGDITPTTAIARAWCILEATVGQIYLVVLVAGLVGHYIAVHQKGASKQK